MADFVGISYGTIAEQVFMLRHPGRVRTMTLISGSPLNIPVYQRAPGNSRMALDYVFALCARQLACHQAFPHLAADWAARGPRSASPPGWSRPQSPTKTTMRLDQDGLADLAYQTLFTGDIGPIPVVVHTLATARNKAAAMISVANAFPAAPSSGGANQMLFYAFRCDEPWASAPPAALSDQRGSFAYHTDLEDALWYQDVCLLIPKSAAAVGDAQPTVSTVPVLAFNGAYDPIEQPRNWAGAQEFFPTAARSPCPARDTTPTPAGEPAPAR